MQNTTTSAFLAVTRVRRLNATTPGPTDLTSYSSDIQGTFLTTCAALAAATCGSSFPSTVYSFQSHRSTTHSVNLATDDLLWPASAPTFPVADGGARAILRLVEPGHLADFYYERPPVIANTEFELGGGTMGTWVATRASGFESNGLKGAQIVMKVALSAMAADGVVRP